MNRPNRGIFLLTTAALAGLALAATRPAASYPAAANGFIVTDLGGLPGQPYSSEWQQTINNGGMIAAYANANADDIADTTFFGDSSFLWKNGITTPLPGLPGAIDTVAFSLNDNRQVVGRSTPLGQRNHAVVWNHGAISLLGELLGDNSSAALKNNNRGEAVGYSRTPASAGNLRHAALWSQSTVSQLPPLPGAGTFDEALGINENGQIAGWSGASPGQEHIALWDNRGVHDLGTLGGDWGEAIAINNKGQVIGFSDTAAHELGAFLWDSGVLTDLGSLPGDVGAAALGLNNQGQIVGVSGATLVNGNAANIYNSHAVLWEGGAAIDLQTRIPAGSGWTITAAGEINSRGMIVGQGVYNGILRAVLLTPIH